MMLLAMRKCHRLNLPNGQNDHKQNFTNETHNYSGDLGPQIWSVCGCNLDPRFGAFVAVVQKHYRIIYHVAALLFAE